MAATALVLRPNVFTALRIQLRVIGALVLRESRMQFAKNRLGYFWAVVEPVIHVAIWVTAINFASLVQPVSRANIIPFYLTGVIIFLAISNIADFLERAISGNQALLYYPIVRPADFIVARWLLQISTQIIVITFIISGAVYLGIVKPPSDIPGMAVAMAIGFLFAFGWGWCNAVFSLLSLTYKRVESILGRLLYFVSGVMFSVEALPPELKHWLSYNPLVHIVELFRLAYFPQYHTSIASPSYVLVFAFVLLVIGVVALRASGSKLYQP